MGITVSAKSWYISVVCNILFESSGTMIQNSSKKSLSLCSKYHKNAYSKCFNFSKLIQTTGIMTIVKV